jgi:hypothetical protein
MNDLMNELLVNEAAPATRDGRYSLDRTQLRHDQHPDLVHARTAGAALATPRPSRRAAPPGSITAARRRLARSLAERLRNGVLGDAARITLCMLAVCDITTFVPRPRRHTHAVSGNRANLFARACAQIMVKNTQTEHTELEAD